MNVNDIRASRACTGCQMCAAVCSHDAIRIGLNEDGFYRPYVDAERCTDCNLCTGVCYRFDEDIRMTTPEKSDAMEVHSAQAKDEALLSNVTSGGVADVLAKELIREGYTCIGVTYNDVHHRAESIAATDVEETDAFRGSKYIQTYSVDAFRQMVRKAKSVKFAVFGLPCHIYAVHKFLSARNLRNNSVLIDMFCHGCPSMYCWTKYEKEIEQIVNRQSFGEVQFRSKRRGWGNYHVSVDVAGGKSFISTPKHDEFYSLFFSDQVLNDACSDCKLRSTMEYTDIRLGDFWGKAYLGDKKGTSAVVVATERGHRLFETVISQFKIRPHKMSEVTAYQSYGKVYKPNRQLREEMLASLRDEKTPLEEAVEIFYSKQGIKLKAIRLLKTVNYYLPFDLVRFLKSI